MSETQIEATVTAVPMATRKLGPTRKRKLKMVQTKFPDVFVAEIRKAADEFGYDSASSLIRDATLKHIRHLRKTAPDKMETWAADEMRRNREKISGIYSAIRMLSSLIVSAAGQSYIRHGDPPQHEYEANMLRLNEFYEILQTDAAAIFKNDRSWFEEAKAEKQVGNVRSED